MTPSDKILRALIIALEEVRLDFNLSEVDKAVATGCLNNALGFLEKQSFNGDVETQVLFSDRYEVDGNLYAIKMKALTRDEKFRTLGAVAKNSQKEVIAELTRRNLYFPPALKAFYEAYHKLPN